MGSIGANGYRLKGGEKAQLLAGEPYAGAKDRGVVVEPLQIFMAAEVDEWIELAARHWFWPLAGEEPAQSRGAGRWESADARSAVLGRRWSRGKRSRDVLDYSLRARHL